MEEGFMATQAAHRTMDAVSLLKADHQKVKGLFREYSELGERAIKTKQKLAEQIWQELEVHSQLEEQIFYPAAREAAEEQVGEVVAEGLEEHHVVDVLIQELKGLSPEDEPFDAKMKVLCENVEHHIEEEETEMLPQAGRKLGDRLESLGQQMMELKKQLTA
jgi:iron-sulfur cluster repair protein YtfE (RIC family)